MSMQEMSKEKWIVEYASGTLRHAYNLGCAIHSLYLEERVAFTYGRYFQPVPNSRITIGIPQAEGDCHPFTEGCWNIRRRLAQETNPKECYSPASYITITHPDNTVETGLGLRLISNPVWLPDGYQIVCIVSPTRKNARGEEEYTGEVRSL